MIDCGSPFPGTKDRVCLRPSLHRNHLHLPHPHTPPFLALRLFINTTILTQTSLVRGKVTLIVRHMHPGQGHRRTHHGRGVLLLRRRRRCIPRIVSLVHQNTLPPHTRNCLDISTHSILQHSQGEIGEECSWLALSRLVCHPREACLVLGPERHMEQTTLLALVEALRRSLVLY